MDVKNRTSSKAAKASLLSDKKKAPLEPKYSDREFKLIGELKKLYLDTVKLDVELQQGIYNLEKSMESKHDEVFDRRLHLLESLKNQSPGDGGEIKSIKNFWLKVLKASYTEFISKKDEQILVYLRDIRAKLYNEPTVKFIIEFHFEPNEYFSDLVLTKTYFLNCLPDSDDPYSYDGAEIYKCEGCKINWKDPQKGKDNKSSSSFFDFFDPPSMPENPEDPTYAHVNAILQNDFELGFYLKERVIPKAILFFTGEIPDCLTSDSETDSEDDEDQTKDDDDDIVGATGVGK
ncbi:milkah [Haematobia irritans]|uniref:milkah n=1 Tax=Haematobia irritans TaxID=7368 RepID=UPI003F506495